MNIYLVNITANILFQLIFFAHYWAIMLNNFSRFVVYINKHQYIQIRIMNCKVRSYDINFNNNNFFINL